MRALARVKGREGAMVRTDGDQNAKQNACFSKVFLKSEGKVMFM